MFLEQFPKEDRANGWIEVICGSMFSGKTEELIRRLNRAKFAHQKIMLVKPMLDHRYDQQKVVSHQGTHFHATCVEHAKNILKTWNRETVVAVDEAQFFDEEIVDVCNDLAGHGVRVIIAGLDMDFQGTPFGPMPQLLSIAEYVTKVHAICVSCGNLAQYSHRIVDDQQQVLVGAVDEYKPLCRSCFNRVNP